MRAAHAKPWDTYLFKALGSDLTICMMSVSSRNILVVAVWWKLLLFADAQNSTIGRSGYEYVDPLIGTTNGGQNSYEDWSRHRC
jgi:hypothetical protein